MKRGDQTEYMHVSGQLIAIMIRQMNAVMVTRL